MKIGDGEMLELEALCRLRLTEAERTENRRALEQALERLTPLEEMDLDGVEPLFHPLAGECPLREDEIERSLPREELLAGAPERKDGYIAAPIALE